MSTAIEYFQCTKAQEFISRLGIGEYPWENNRTHWVFRGHSDDDFKLIPAALRSKAILGSTYNKKGIQPTNYDQIQAEFERLHEFYWAVDSQGLHIPGESNLLRTPKGWDTVSIEVFKNGWPIDGFLPLLALAQHYGVHTRLLDWSANPLVAAYFAASGITSDSINHNISVWGLNLDWVINTGFPASKNDLSIYVVTAPRASNPNLHTQEGIFTTPFLNGEEIYKNMNLKSVDELVQDKWNITTDKYPVMFHMTLPINEAPSLLRLLNQEGISAATMYPGYEGAAKSLKERELWDKIDRCTYWRPFV